MQATADLVGQRHDLARAAWRQPRSGCDVLGSHVPSLPYDQIPDQAALVANARVNGQFAEDGEPGWGPAGLYDPLLTAEDPRRPDPASSTSAALSPR